MIMSWIYWMFFILIQTSSKSMIKKLNVAFAVPLEKGRVPFAINPYIQHWEPAHFDRNVFENAHQKHEISRRRKREINYNHHSPHYGGTNTIEFSIKAHDREFHIKLKEDPTSVFAPDFVVENSDGPLDFDVSRVYTGSLKDDENSHVHGVLTNDNLFDGTIITSTEHFYIEPSQRYSEKLFQSGVHTIIYKVSDVKLNAHNQNYVNPLANKHDHDKHCMSEKLHQKLKDEISRESELKLSNKLLRAKRWVQSSDESSSEDEQEPPLPLEDLKTPYNTRVNVNVNSDDDYQNDQAPSSGVNVNRNVLINSYNPNSDYNLRNIITKTNRNILTNVFDGMNNNNHHPNRVNVNVNSSINSRPNHKTHVEIITKNGPTKRPSSNVIVNNYNPDLIYANNNPPNKVYPNNNQFPYLYQPPNQLNVNMNAFDMLNIKSTSSGSPADRKSTCMLYLQADHTFFQKLGSDEASIESITRHVQRANVIYRNTDFNGDMKPDNITFMIKRIKVHNMNALKDPTYRFPGNYGVEKFLELFSEENYDQFCLAYMFTYRDFEMGTLGLAWTGDLKNAGGVCEKNGHYRGSLKSLNTGIVTLLNYGKHVPPAVSHVTLAHEIGHNFGSPHDPDQCTPGGDEGNFIMFARATSGDKKNNNKFSPCSLKSIEPVLNTKARSSKGCFTEPQPAICGNGVVEDGEECDCGWEEDCKDDCCYPMSGAQSSFACKLKPNFVCSPSQGPCCTSQCTLKYGDKCRDDNGCRDNSFCDGRSAHCPPSTFKPNKTICNKEFVCFNGECTGSICLAYGLESCQCIPGPNDPKTKSCELCCKKPGENMPCLSSFDPTFNVAPYDVPDMYSKPGTPCNDYNGYCDVFQRCREVDPSGPLATLRKLLLSEEGIASFKKWVISNWYAVSLIVVAVFALLILSTRYLGKKSNMKLKTVTIIHSATTETVRLPDDNNGVIVHTAVRTKVPLKKKVRGERKKKHQQQSMPVSASKENTAAATAAAATTNTSSGVSTQKNTPRHKTFHHESPRKLLRQHKKKKSQHRTSSAENDMKGNEEMTQQQQQQPRRTKKATKPKEIIDYSNPQQHLNTFGKVQKWLLESPIVASAASQFEHSSKVPTTTIMNKSHSNPEHLSSNGKNQNQPQHKLQRSSKPKLKAPGVANNKVRLQVVFKPPFKFALKLSKNENLVKTGEPNAKKNDVRRRSSLDVPTQLQQQQQPKTKRAALLIRTTADEMDNLNEHLNDYIQEPIYETLNPKTLSNQRKKASTLPTDDTLQNYENLPTTSSTANLMDATLNNSFSTPINTATFRVNKSSSGNNITNRNLPVISPDSLKKSQKHRLSNSSSSLIKLDGSLQNLTRSSTTNLAKKTSSSSSRHDVKRRASDMNRSSTTNLNKYHRQQSHSNLRRGDSNVDVSTCPVPQNSSGAAAISSSSHSPPNNNSIGADGAQFMVNEKKSSHMRKSSLSNSNVTTSCQQTGSSRRESFKNNIPRASLINSTIANALSSNLFSQRQTSFNAAKPTPLSHQSRLNIDELNKGRPNTSSCDSSMFKNFEWPKVLTTQRSLPAENALQSDLEVFVSDGETLVNDS